MLQAKIPPSSLAFRLWDEPCRELGQYQVLLGQTWLHIKWDFSRLMPSKEACSTLNAGPKTKMPVVAIISDHPAEDVPMPKLSALLIGPP